MLTTKGQNNSNTLEYKHRDLRLIIFFQQKWKKYKIFKRRVYDRVIVLALHCICIPKEV